MKSEYPTSYYQKNKDRILPKAREYQRKYRAKKKAEEPFWAEKRNDYIRTYLAERRAKDPAFREKLNAKNRERYRKQREALGKKVRVKK